MNWPIFFRLKKNTLLFICSTNILVRLLTVNMENCLTPPKSENMLPHYDKSSRENGTTASGTYPLASYKEVPHPHPPPLGLKTVTQQMQKESCHVRRSLKGWNRLQLIFSLEKGESNPKNNSQLYNSNFIRSEIKLNKYILFKKCNQITDTWN